MGIFKKLVNKFFKKDIDSSHEGYDPEKGVHNFQNDVQPVVDSASSDDYYEIGDGYFKVTYPDGTEETVAVDRVAKKPVPVVEEKVEATEEVLEETAKLTDEQALEIRTEFSKQKKWTDELAEELAKQYDVSVDEIKDVYDVVTFTDPSTIPQKYAVGSKVKVINKSLKLYGATGTVNSLKSYVTKKYVVDVNGRKITINEDNIGLMPKPQKRKQPRRRTKK